MDPHNPILKGPFLLSLIHPNEWVCTSTLWSRARAYFKEHYGTEPFIATSVIPHNLGRLVKLNQVQCRRTGPGATAPNEYALPSTPASAPRT